MILNMRDLKVFTKMKKTNYNNNKLCNLTIHNKLKKLDINELVIYFGDNSL